jgi:glycosyltransferase involved in cell wall biosynthesis
VLATFRLSSLGFGGTERVFISVADHLSAACGWSVDFVVDTVDGHETEQVAIAKGHGLVGLNASRTWKTILPFARYLNARRPDVVISAYTDTNAAALMASALSQWHVPVVVTEHAPLDEHWAGKPWLRRMLLAWMVRYVYKLASRVVCVSRGMAEQLGKRLNHRYISHIHNPVRFGRRTRSLADARRLLGMDQDVRVILAVGRICRAKNYLMLLEAFRNLRCADKLCLYIVGGVFEVDEALRLNRFIADHRLPGQVTLVGFTHELQAYYEAADLLVLSSAWEGFGNVLVEGLAFGLPIVSTRCNFGPAEILADGEFGELIDVDDHLAMGQAIDRVLARNPFHAERQVRRAGAYSEARVGEAYRRLICEARGESLHDRHNATPGAVVTRSRGDTPDYLD